MSLSSLILTDQDHAQEPGPYFTGPTSEDTILFSQETQSKLWLGNLHARTSAIIKYTYTTYMHKQMPPTR